MEILTLLFVPVKSFSVYREILLVTSVNSVIQAVFCEINFRLSSETNESSVLLGMDYKLPYTLVNTVNTV